MNGWLVLFLMFVAAGVLLYVNIKYPPHYDDDDQNKYPPPGLF